MSDFLFELGVEELPVAAVKALSDGLRILVTQSLANLNITHGEVKQFGTPRRLALLIHQLAPIKPGQVTSRRGPAVSGSRDEQGKALPALLGFARSCGVAVDDLTVTTTDKGAWWAFESSTPDIETKTLLPDIFKQALLQLPIKKPMRWGDGQQQFSRPVHWLVMLWDDEVLDTELLGVRSGAYSHGHRFHHPEAFRISAPAQYVDQLYAMNVIVDFAQRRAVIQAQILKLAAERSLIAVIPEALLDEVTSIVEWPHALEAQFERAFLEVPAEVLIAAMQHHQKSFALRDQQGRLAPYFIAVSNIESNDPQRVRLGQEKVMHARLSDAAFFYQQDKKQALSARIPALQQVVYQASLGSLADKAARMALILKGLGDYLALDPVDAQRAAALCKCDLLTGMVSEFPELQGLMGSYYALHDNESPGVALAIQEHYLPRFAKDDLPSSALGLALSLADRMDTLVGLFAIGQKPTGVKDPYKLRRHALAVVKMMIAASSALRLSDLIALARASYGDRIPECSEAMEALRLFMLERLQSYYQSQEIPGAYVSAVRACQEDDLFDCDQRMTALLDFVQHPDAQALAAMAKRVVNVLAQAEWPLHATDSNPSLFKEPIEETLFALLESTEQAMAHPDRTTDYQKRLQLLADMHQTLDQYFQHVMVMTDELPVRHNRLSLLARLRLVLLSVVDLGLMAVPKK